MKHNSIVLKVASFTFDSCRYLNVSHLGLVAEKGLNAHPGSCLPDLSAFQSVAWPPLCVFQ